MSKTNQLLINDYEDEYFSQLEKWSAQDGIFVRLTRKLIS